MSSPTGSGYQPGYVSQPPRHKNGTFLHPALTISYTRRSVMSSFTIYLNRDVAAVADILLTAST